MEFSPELRGAVLSGEITVSFRLWSRPKVKVGGRYRVGSHQIEVDSVELVPFFSIDDDDLQRSGETCLESLRRRAAHAGPIHDDTLLYRVEFHVVGSRNRPASKSRPNPPIPPSIEWLGNRVRLVDQRRLPEDLVFIEASTVDELCDAIASLAIRGAPALGAAGAMGIALASCLGDDLDDAARRLIATRPTAVNLRWGVERARAAADPVQEAVKVAEEDSARNRRLARLGAVLLPPGARVLTHCNAGSLACVEYGTAIGVIRAAHEAGNPVSVWVDETRPVLQGSRLTAWELSRLGIPATVLVDGAAGSVMARGQVDCVLVGADRIAANGDVANKIGTYSIAVLARYHRIPFYVAAPVSTIDLDCPSGADIPVEQRDPREVAPYVPVGVVVANPAFDVTPARLITAIITDAGVASPPFRRVLATFCRR